jgi:CheY-like chemotaxis protein
MNDPLKGRLILIAEDDPLIALQMTKAFEDVGAWVLRARTLKEALAWVEGRKLCAAVLDHTLSDSDTSTVCKRMNERNIPFVLYSGYEKSDGAAHQGVHASVLARRPNSRDLGIRECREHRLHCRMLHHGRRYLQRLRICHGPPKQLRCRLERWDDRPILLDLSARK